MIALSGDILITISSQFPSSDYLLQLVDIIGAAAAAAIVFCTILGILGKAHPNEHHHQSL